MKDEQATIVPVRAHQQPASSRCGSRRTEKILVLLTLSLIAGAWFGSSIRSEADVIPFVQQAFPGNGVVTKQDDGLYAVWTDASEADLMGYVAIGSADGYGGPLRVAVAVDINGQIVGAVIISQKETPAWIERVITSDLMGSLIGKRTSDAFEIGNDVDGVTGATYSARGLAGSVLDGSRLAANRLGLPVNPPQRPEVVFGIPEVVLLLLFAIGYIAHQGSFRFKKQARWGSMLVGLVVLGFIYNSPVTLAYITKLTLGYWPQWQTNLYWYFLIGGLFFVVTIDGKNPYCQWFCPFGAAQECMGVIGGAKGRTTDRFAGILKWMQRLLALTAVLLGIWFRSPGLASYELFGTLFELLGSWTQFIALGLVLVAAMFIKRPWCNFLCPIRPVTDLISSIRQIVREQWRKIVNRAKLA